MNTTQLHMKALNRASEVMAQGKKEADERRAKDLARLAAAGKSAHFEVPDMPKKKKKKYVPTNLFVKKEEVKPVGQLQKIVVDYLKGKSPRFCSAEEILKDTNIDVLGDEELRLSLGNNMRVNVENGKYAFRSRYNIKDKTEIVNLISHRPNGLNRGDLKDSYVGIEDDIDALIENRDIICIKNEEKRYQMLYPRYTLFGKSNMPSDIQKLWKEVRIPDQIDLQRALIAWGMKKAEDNTVLNGMKVAKEVKVEKQKKRRKRKFERLTNTHIPNFSLDTEIVDPEKKTGSTSTW